MSAYRSCPCPRPPSAASERPTLPAARGRRSGERNSWLTKLLPKLREAEALKDQDEERQV